MTVTVRPARSGDGAGISRAWLSAAAYYAGLDPEHFQVPEAEGLADGWDNRFDRPDDDSLQLVAEVDGQVVGWLWARIQPPGPNASAQLTREHGWTRLVVMSLIVDRGHWRGGAGTALLEAAEAWGRAQGAQVASLDTWAYSPVSVPFYEDHLGYQRRSITFQKRI
jgi:GNAT superfamily N-acetyltransferase